MTARDDPLRIVVNHLSDFPSQVMRNLVKSVEMSFQEGVRNHDGLQRSVTGLQHLFR